MNSETSETSPGEPSNAALFRRLWQLSWRYRFGCLKVLTLQFVVTALTLAGLALVGLAIDVVRHAVDPRSLPPHYPFGWQPPTGWSAQGILTGIALLVLATAALKAYLAFLHAWSAAWLVQGQIVVDLRARVYDQLQRLSFRFFDQNASGSVINRVTGDVQSVRQFVDGVMMQLVVVLFSLACYVGYMFSIHVWLSIACLVTTPFLWTLSAAYSRLLRPAYDRNRELVDQMILRLTENLQGVLVVKAFTRESQEQAKFAEASERVRDQQRWIFFWISTYTPTISFLTQVNLGILLLYGGNLVISGELPLGTGLVVFAGLLQQFSAQITAISSIANSIQQSLTGARRVFEILDTEVEIRSPREPVRLPKARGALVLEDVSFAYRDGQPVLSDINLSIQPGECVAILGATGAGKSTLLALLPRFYDPERGRITLDGHDLKAIDLDDLRRNIGIVFQESFLFSNTIRANISFGHPQATDEQIEAAARIAAAHDFIMALPDGYDSVLGEGGVDLSGGQRQRLAIARAILLEPSVLLLDDPTASIDASTEEEILAAMEAAMHGRTTLVVAHRLSTLRRADRVIVLEAGRIVQSGTHETLLAATGPYRQAALFQSGDFARHGEESPTSTQPGGAASASTSSAWPDSTSTAGSAGSPPA